MMSVSTRPALDVAHSPELPYRLFHMEVTGYDLFIGRGDTPLNRVMHEWRMESIEAEADAELLRLRRRHLRNRWNVQYRRAHR